MDEDRALAQTLRAALEPRSHVEAAPTGAGALESIARFPFEVVLLDQCLPGLPGVTVHRTIKKTFRRPRSSC